MAKFNYGLVKEIKAEENRKRTKDKKEKIKRVVVNGTLSPISFIIRKIATIILLILAAIGLLALIYPQTRTAMHSIIVEQWQQIKTLLNM